MIPYTGPTLRGRSCPLGHEVDSVPVTFLDGQWDPPQAPTGSIILPTGQYLVVNGNTTYGSTTDETAKSVFTPQADRLSVKSSFGLVFTIPYHAV